VQRVKPSTSDVASGIIRLGLISFEALTSEEGVSMSYGSYGPPWGMIMARKKLQEAEDAFRDWRARLVEVGERLMREVDKGTVSEQAKREFREFIEEAKAAGIRRHL